MLVVIPHDGDDDAVRIANDSAYGLSGSVDSGRPRAGQGGRRAGSAPARSRQRRRVVQPGRAVRRLQAVRHRPGDGRGRLRGVPRDQDDRRAGMRSEHDDSRTRSSSSPARRRASARPTPRALAAEGASVVVADLNAEPGEQVAEEIEADGGAAIFVAHRRVVARVGARRWSTRAVAAYGGIDLLVNNAAIYGDMAVRPADHRRLGLLPEVHVGEHGRRPGDDPRGLPARCRSAAAARSSTRARPRRSSTPASTAWPRSASTA